MSQRMHLISFLIHSPINHTILSWTDPADERLDALGSLQSWLELGQTLERGGFTAVFFADTPGIYDRYRDRVDESLEYGVCWPPHDPMVVLSAMATATSHLGLAVTMSLSAIPPYAAIRTLSTLDYLSGGRVGWNVVTGHLRGEYRAMGLDQLEHDERYDRADEYMEVCYRIWNAIEPGAILMDRETGRFADPDRIGRIDHQGKYFRCQGVPPTLPSAQGHPVIFQAGSSGRGQKFAVKHAEVMFSIQPHEEGMKRYMSQLGETAKAERRKDPVRVTFGVQPILGGSEAEAQRNYDDMVARVPVDAALARLSGSLGVDFSKFDLDKPMEELDTQASRGMMAAMAASIGDRRFTLREVASLWGMAVGMMPIIGTPEQVADRLERIWRETGCMGFNVTPTLNNQSIRDFVDEVVPLLERKGVYQTDYADTTLRGNLLS